MKIILLSLLSFFLFSCGEKTENTQQKGLANLQVDGYKVISSPFNTEMKTTAELLASEQVELRAPLSGQVLEIYFKEGQKVSQGTPIIRLDDRSWKAQLTGLNVQLNTLEKEYSRKKILLEKGGSSQEELEQAFSSLETLKSQVQQLNINIELANINAPFSGQLGLRNFSKGAYLQVGDVITSITNTNQLKVDFTIPQENKESIKIGEEVMLIINDDSLKAKVYTINPLINSTSRTIEIRALLNQPKNNIIMPGTFAEVIIPINFTENALLVPTQAIVPEITEQTVFVYKNGIARRQTVLLGSRTPDKIQILKGIEKGDTVITTGLLQIKEGMPVTLQALKP